MSRVDGALVNEARIYVKQLLEEKLSAEYLFHSWRHTQKVIENSLLIAQYSGLEGEDLNILQLSACFHDVGYISSNDNHETDSVFIAEEFLRVRQISENVIKVVSQAILCTRVPQRPADLISEILCDADLMHFADEDYFEQMELLRLEWQVTGKFFFNEYQFHMNSIEFFNKHQYHTDYGKTILQDKKVACLRKIQQRVETLRHS